MKRLVSAVLLAAVCSACAVQRWVGKPVARLEKEYGQPTSIRRDGDNRIYIYPDELAGRGEMTFTVDRRGIIRSWCATADVPSVFADEGLFADGGFGTASNTSNNGGFGGTRTTGGGGGFGGPRAAGRLPRVGPGTNPGAECR
jgi:hypothetical protein